MPSSLSAIKSALPTLGGNSAAFSAARQAMAELGVAGCIGMGCVKQEYLTPSMVGALSKTTFSILLPFFLGTSIIKTVTTYGLNRSSLTVPVLAAAQSFILLLLTRHVLLPLFGIDRDTDDGRCSAVCCSFGNSGVVPFIFCESLFRSPYEPAENLAKSYAQISLYLIGWSPFFWSFGRSVLLGSDTSSDANEISEDKWKRCLQSMRRLFPPPVVGVMIGLFIAISPLKWLFVSTAEYKAPLAVVYNTVQNFGRAASPLSLLVLTASLAIGASKNNEGPTKPEDDDVSFLRRWSCVSTSRFLISPLLMLGMLNALAKVGIVGGYKENPMLWFVLMLESCMPPAQNSVIMLQVANKGAKAGQMAKFLFSAYATSMLPVVLILTMALQTFGLA